MFRLTSENKELSSPKTPPPAKSPAAEATLESSPKKSAEPFRWSQLESPNSYFAYVAKLRAAGCPEPTIRDIVQGDADRAFNFKRRQLNLDGSGTGSWSQTAERILVARLLGDALPAEVEAMSVAKQHLNKKAADVSYPLVFQNVDTVALGLTDAQKEAVAEIQQQFVEEIGGANQDVSDPGYLERWKKAQPEMDSQLRAWLGGKAFMEYEMAAQENAGVISP